MKNQTKYTPSPWIIERDQLSLRIKMSKKIIADVHWLEHFNSVSRTIIENEATKEESLSNARLIAAAPELLEAAKNLIRVCKTEYNHDEPPPALETFNAIKQLEKAINKAEGK